MKGRDYGESDKKKSKDDQKKNDDYRILEDWYSLTGEEKNSLKGQSHKIKVWFLGLSECNNTFNFSAEGLLLISIINYCTSQNNLIILSFLMENAYFIFVYSIFSLG